MDEKRPEEAQPTAAASAGTADMVTPWIHGAEPGTAAGDAVRRVRWGAVALFAVIAFGLAWLVQLPSWLTGGLGSPLFMPLTAVMMYTPTVAALIVTFFVIRPARRARYLGLVPFRPVGRKIALFLLWPVFWLAVGFSAFLLAYALGWTGADWELTALQAGLPAGQPMDVFLLVTFASLPISVALSTLAAFGEELGWRGFLTTALAPLGFWRSAILSGLLWGLWHAPVILLGYNYFRPDLLGVLLMCGFTLSVGILLQWSRYWTGNVWPAAVGHGALNACASLTLLWLPADGDPAIATILGVPGWIVMALVVVLLVVTGALRRRTTRALAEFR